MLVYLQLINQVIEALEKSQVILTPEIYVISADIRRMNVNNIE